MESSTTDWSNVSLGAGGEDIAASIYHDNGLVIIDRNYNYYSKGRGRRGEIDLIAYDKRRNVVHFVEVKTRMTQQFGHPLEQISSSKITSLHRAIQKFCIDNPKYSQSYKQVDVVGILPGKEPVIFYNAITFD